MNYGDISSIHIHIHRVDIAQYALEMLTLPLIYSFDFIFRQYDATLFHSIPNARENATELLISLSLAWDDYYSFFWLYTHYTHYKYNNNNQMTWNDINQRLILIRYL